MKHENRVVTKKPPITAHIVIRHIFTYKWSSIINILVCSFCKVVLSEICYMGGNRGIFSDDPIFVLHIFFNSLKIVFEYFYQKYHSFCVFKNYFAVVTSTADRDDRDRGRGLVVEIWTVTLPLEHVRFTRSCLEQKIK